MAKVAKATQADNEPALRAGKSGGTVTVACKLPAGLRLRVFEMVDVSHPIFGGGVKIVKEARQVSDDVFVRGTSAPAGQNLPYAVVGGYALTHGIDRDFFERWLEQNRDSDVVRNGLIFAADGRDHAEGRAGDLKETRHGAEPLDMSMRIARGPDGTERRVVNDRRVNAIPGGMAVTPTDLK